MLSSEVADRVVTLAIEAGEKILEVYNREETARVKEKADGSPVTEADLAAHHYLEPMLRQLLGKVPVISEEGGLPDFAERSAWRRYWIIDPLDGTKEFINRTGEFTVNIALVDDGQPVFGVVHVPLKKLTYTGRRGAGAWRILDGRKTPIRTRRVEDEAGTIRPIDVVASRRHGTEKLDALIKSLENHFPQVSTKNMGSSLKLCLVAEGEADLYPRLAPTSEWDTAAAQAVVEAAGGTVLDDQLEPLRYNQKESILNPHFYVVGDPAWPWNRVLAP